MHVLRRRIESGYTLVELSIVIIIVSLLTAGGLAIGSSMVERAAYIDTQKHIAALQQTLHDFYVVNGRLPCVADLAALPSTADFGDEIPNCSSGGTAPGETFRDSATGVRIGMIPTRTLGLPDSAAQDKYGNRIFYAVAEDSTHKDFFGGEDGAILVRDASHTPILTNAVYFLFSAGRDRKGAYGYQTGELDPNCDSTPGNLDVLNCDTSDSEFRDAPFNNGDVTERYFDDLTAWAPKFHFMSYDTQSSSLWTAQPMTENIFAAGPDGLANTGNVGIGTGSPASKLDVVGNVGVQGSYTATGTERVGISYRRTDDRDARIMIGDSTARWSIASGWGTAGEFSLIQEGISGNRIYVDASGNVGLSTSEPEQRLHVQGNLIASRNAYEGAGVYIRNELKTGGKVRDWVLWNMSTGGPYTYGDGLAFWRYQGNGGNAGPSFFLRDNGNVGIGTTSPNDALDVKGGKIRGQHACAEYDSGGSWNRAVASCPAGRWLLSGGGWCANLTQDAMILNRPNGNSWQAECYRHDGPWDAVAYARAICCLD